LLTIFAKKKNKTVAKNQVLFESFSIAKNLTKKL
jgi:hypothetical protein